MCDRYQRWSASFHDSMFERWGKQRLMAVGMEESGMQYWSVCGFFGVIMALLALFVFRTLSPGEALFLFCGGFLGGVGAAMGLYQYMAYLRRLGMRGEALGLQSVVLLLMNVPNITMMEVLDALGACGELFRKRFLRCAVEYAAEDTKALERMQEAAEHSSFRELVARLIASERIGLKAAFEELDADCSFFREQIRLDREEEQKKKAANAQVMVFLPMLFLLFAYLILPFLGISMKQMGEVFREMEQIRYLG